MKQRRHLPLPASLVRLALGLDAGLLLRILDGVEHVVRHEDLVERPVVELGELRPPAFD
jgi:hypothetical protein